jgi:hydroxyatrazine ethylaminohydrolase
MSDDILIKNAAAIVTCDTNDTIFRDCDLLIKGPEIKEIGPNLTAGQAEVIDATGCFV